MQITVVSIFHGSPSHEKINQIPVLKCFVYALFRNAVSCQAFLETSTLADLVSGQTFNRTVCLASAAQASCIAL